MGTTSPPTPSPLNSTKKTLLEDLPNVGIVDVSVSSPTMERGYSWSITFLSSPAYFPILTKNVDTLESHSPFDDKMI